MTRGVRWLPASGQKQNRDAHELLVWQIRNASDLPPCEVEYFFAKAEGRMLRWDIAFVPRLIAVEVNGGIWSKGAHGHPITILRNMEKLNIAARLGWRHLAFTPDQVQAGEALAFTESVLLGNKTVDLCNLSGESHATAHTPARERARLDGLAAYKASSRSRKARR